MRVNVYRLLSDCVERGLEIGWRRAHKHTTSPDEGAVYDAQHTAIMGELCEVFTFDDPA